MSVPPEEGLRELLLRLHERLANNERLEPESRELLVTVRRDIQRVLAGAERSGGAPGEVTPRAGRDSALEELEALEVRFETEHPAMAQAIRQLIDLLGKAGI